MDLLLEKYLGEAKDRGTFGLEQGKTIKVISDVKKGDLIIGVSKQFKSTNLYKVVGIRDGNKLDVEYSDAKGKKLDGGKMTVWDFDLKKGGHFKIKKGE